MATPKIFHYDNLPRLDAAQNVFFERELMQTASKAYDKKYALLKGRTMIPTGEAVAPGVEQFRYEQYDMVGQAKPISDYAADSPKVNASAAEFFQSMKDYSLSFQYSLQEVEASSYANKQLDMRRAMAVRKGLAQKLDDICFSGDAAYGLKGLNTLDNTLTYTIQNGVGSSPLWTLKTADEIMKDVGDILDKVPNDSRDIEVATRFLLPTPKLRYIARKRVGTTTETTVLTLLKQEFPGVEFVGWERLTAAGTNGSDDKIIAYNPSVDNLFLLMSLEYEQQAPEQRNFAFVVNARMRTGGVVCPYPKSVCYAETF